MNTAFHRTLLALTAFALLVTGTRAGEISLASLLDDMTNLSAMAEYPDPAYTTKQFSSYDRASKTPEDHDPWFANGDCGVYLRTEERDGRKEFVMADMEGPGTIVRMWSANPAGVIRIYIDGSDKPALEYAHADLLSGKHPLMPSPIGATVSAGWNLYLPIPYAKSCKVTCDKDGQYYHVNYRTYARGTDVKSFTLEQLEAAKKDVAKVAKQLADPQTAVTIPDSASLSKVTGTLPAEKSLNLVNRQDGAGAIIELSVQINLPAEKRDAALRAVIVKMTFDDQQTVEAPLGDFFGSAPGVNPYDSLPLIVKPNGQMISHWVMPYEKSATITLVNLGKEAVPLKSEVAAVSRKWTANSMHFHACWRTQFDVPTRPMIDWNYLDATGKGVFAGVAFFIDNSSKAWWGEGDEKIYVDGETFPSHFGTGTEDYYGYAWCSPEKFTHAYHAQPRCDGPANYGRTSVNRFDILDRIPFAKSFKFDMELWHWADCKVNLAVIDYYYGVPGTKDAFKPITADEATLRPWPVWTPAKVAGAIEGETMKVIKKAGSTEPQAWEGLSDEKQLWWRGAQLKDELVLGFDVPKAGKYEVVGHFMKAPDYGIAQLSVNGEKAGEPIDFYNDGVAPSPEISLGTFELKQGENQFSATITGANDKAQKQYMFGLDYLLLKPAK
jgi:hypothetical protein